MKTHKRFRTSALAIAARLRVNDSGQGMTEYILIVALIAILSIGMVSFFGNNIRGLFQVAGNALAGEQVDTSKLKTSTAETKKSVKDLGTYNEAP